MPPTPPQKDVRHRFISVQNGLKQNIGWASLAISATIIGLSSALLENASTTQWFWAIAGVILGSGVTYTYVTRSKSNNGIQQIVSDRRWPPEYRFFRQYLTQRMRERQNIALLICNIDFLSQFNLTYGRPAGDTCLNQVHDCLKQCTRKGDLVTRMSVDFILILPNTDEYIAIQIAERVRSQVEQLNIPHKSSTIAKVVTISGGLAFCKAQDTITSEDFLASASRLLSLSKNRGRNQITNRFQGLFADSSEA